MRSHHIALLALTISLSACGGATTRETARTVVPDAEVGTQEQTPTRVATSGGEQPALPANPCAAAGVRPVYFNYDDDTLASTARDQLAADARCLQAQRTVEVSLVGATDPRGTEEYNLALGDRRARAVADYLASLGVARNRMRIRSVGEEMATGESETGWAQDRRVQQD